MQVQGNSVVLKGLTQYTSYKVKVRGRNTQNAGPWSSTDVITLGQLIPHKDYVKIMNLVQF